jgi:hypothetical protein
MMINKLKLNIAVAKRITNFYLGPAPDQQKYPNCVMVASKECPNGYREIDFTKPEFAWTIIEKVFDELLQWVNNDGVSDYPEECTAAKWNYLINLHNCSKSEAALIHYSDYKGEPTFD